MTLPPGTRSSESVTLKPSTRSKDWYVGLLCVTTTSSGPDEICKPMSLNGVRPKESWMMSQRSSSKNETLCISICRICAMGSSSADSAFIWSSATVREDFVGKFREHRIWKQLDTDCLFIRNSPCRIEMRNDVQSTTSLGIRERLKILII